ncbi:MAG: hypothetical protein JNM31_01230 [Flavobacteriales bacterium]|nr:hypothetical protein [Flavobacteriales bacterium]
MLSAGFAHAQEPVVPSPADTSRATQLQANYEYRGHVGTTPPDRMWKQPHQLRVEASGMFDASTVYNDLILGLRDGGYVDQATRQRSSDALRDNNRFGQELLFRITYVGPDSMLGRSRWRPMVAVAHHDITGLRFTRDLFRVTFFGNAAYEDSTARLAPSAHEQQRYQTIGFGLQDKHTASFFRLDAVNGQLLSASRLRTADLHTATNGTALVADLDGDYWASADQSEFFNGWGLAASGRWNFTPKPWKEHPMAVAVWVEDLGFVHWRNRSQQLHKDSVIDFQGLAVENLFDLPDPLIGEGDLLDTLGVAPSEGSFNRMLPMRVGASWTLLSRDLRWHWTMAADQRLVPGYVPRALIYASRDVGRCHIGVNTSYGGFGTWQVGAQTSFELGRHLYLDVRSTDLIGLFTRQARGQQLGVVLGVGW